MAKRRKHLPQAEPTAISTNGFAECAPRVGNFFFYAAALLLALPTLIAPQFSVYGYSPDLHMAFMFQVGVLGLWLWYWLAHLKAPTLYWVKSPLLWAMLAFYAWALVSIFWAYNKFESLISLLDWGAGVLMFVLMLNAIRSADHIRLITQGIFASMFLLSLLGIFQYLLDVQWVQQHAKPAATFNNKNMAAQYCLMGVFLGLGLFGTARTTVSIWFYAIASTVCALFVFYTFTRNANLSTIAALSFSTMFISISLIRYDWARKGLVSVAYAAAILAVAALMYMAFKTPDMEIVPVVVLSLAVGWLVVSLPFVILSMLVYRGKVMGFLTRAHYPALLVAALIFSLMVQVSDKGYVGMDNINYTLNRGSGIFSNELNPNTLDRGHRLDIWRNTIALIKDHPIIGVGMGNWMVHYPKYQTAVSPDREMSEAVQHINTHNDYLEIFSDLGAVGFGLLLLMAATMVYLALRNFYGYLHNPNRFLILGILAALIGISVNGIASFPFKQPAPIFVICTLFALLANDLVRVQGGRVAAMRARIIPHAAAFATLFAALSAFALHYQWNQSEIHFRVATISSHRQDYHRMIREGLASHDALPLRKRMLNFAGMGFLRTGNPEKAAEYLEQVKTAYPHRNNTLQNLGFVYLQLAEERRRANDAKPYFDYLELAKENFSHLVEIRPDNARAQQNLGLTYHRQSLAVQGEQKYYFYAEAVKYLDEAARLNPNVPESLRSLARNLRTEVLRYQAAQREQEGNNARRAPNTSP